MIEENNHFPLVSIVTPSFNQAGFIERTIKSVIGQNYPRLEHIVMDGSSTDGTIEILKKYDNQIKWFSEKDEGQADAINKGIKMAKGEIVAYLNSDDTYEPGALQSVVRFFRNDPDRMWVFGKCRIVNENDKEVRRLITEYKNIFLKRYNYSTLLVLNYISQPAVFWRKNAAEAIGKFSLKEFWELDYDYWLRLGKLYRPGFIDEYLANFRVHKEAKTSRNIKHFLGEIKVAGKYTKNPVLIGLHYLNFLSIYLGYSMISKLSKIKP